MKRLLIGAAVVAALGSIGTAAAAWDYGYDRYDRHYRYNDMRYRDSDGDGRSDYREWNRDRDRDGRPDQWDRWDNRRHHYGRSYHRHYRYYDAPRYGYYSHHRGYYARPYDYDYRYRYRGW